MERKKNKNDFSILHSSILKEDDDEDKIINCNTFSFYRKKKYIVSNRLKKNRTKIHVCRFTKETFSQCFKFM